MQLLNVRIESCTVKLWEHRGRSDPIFYLFLTFPFQSLPLLSKSLHTISYSIHFIFYEFHLSPIIWTCSSSLWLICHSNYLSTSHFLWRFFLKLSLVRCWTSGAQLLIFSSLLCSNSLSGFHWLFRGEMSNNWFSPLSE